MTLALRGLAALTLCAALAAVTGCENAPGYPRTTEVDRPEHQLDFHTLYGQNCAGCHGNNGRGGAALPLNNPALLAIAGAGNLRAVASHGVKGSLMPAFAASSSGMLTDQQIDAIVQGMLREWSKPSAVAGAALPPWAVGPGNAAGGAAVYQAACARCHGVDGSGTKSAGHSIVDTAYLALVDDQSLHTVIAAGHPESSTPDWRSYLGGGRALTAQQIDDLVAWLAAHRASASTPGGSPAGVASPSMTPSLSKEKP
ncbi:MAG: c-type cytochrome [Terracidiphilus sp.]|nr:c-type cytochrome [Terracidiphilus sp.]